jgi:hypothetical protein
MLVYLAIVVIIIILILLMSPTENYTNPTIKPEPYIKLYERFNQKNMIFDFEPLLSNPTYMYLKKIVKADVKSIDLNMPLKNDNLDDVRRIQIWNIYDGDNTASSESDFYNSYTESDFARKANDAKYKLLIDMKAGNRIKLNMAEPIKKLFIYARF